MPQACCRYQVVPVSAMWSMGRSILIAQILQFQSPQQSLPEGHMSSIREMHALQLMPALDQGSRLSPQARAPEVVAKEARTRVAKEAR